MFHLVARAPPGALLFRTWSEARSLWDRLVEALPGLHGLVLMPDHVHLMHPDEVHLALGAAASGYTRWRNHHRGERGSAFRVIGVADALVDDQKVRRSFRYLALNPCRAGLVSDPLDWPFSSYRDSLGLAVSPVRRPHPNPDELHRYVSSDPTVRVDGTALPMRSVAVPTPEQVLHAVSSLTRTPLPAMRGRGPARSLYLRAARTLCDATHAGIADLVDCSRFAVLRSSSTSEEEVRRVERVLGDLRFDGLLDGDLRQLPRWRLYRRHS